MPFITTIVLITNVWYARAAVEIKETGGGIWKPGDSITLTCRCSGFTFTDYYMHWARQQPGSGLEWVGMVRNPANGGTTEYSPTLRDRVTISRDNSRSEVYLQIKTLKAEDSALYYCARYYSHFDHWGQGTMVTVSAAPDTCPSVFPIAPCCSALDGRPVNIGCLVTGLSDPNTHASWESSSGQVTGPQVKEYPSVFGRGSYSSYTLLNVSSNDFKSKSYKCKLNRIVKAVPVCQKPQVLKVKVYAGKCAADFKELICLVDDHFPKDVSIIWTVNAEPVSASNKTVVKEESGFYKTRSTVMLKTDKWFAGHDITCKATTSKHGDTVPISKTDTIKSCAEKYFESGNH